MFSLYARPFAFLLDFPFPYLYTYPYLYSGPGTFRCDKILGNMASG
jgi:hypothetical protein